MVVVFALSFDPYTVLMASVLTAVMASALTFYAYYTESDYTEQEATLFIAVCVLIVGGIISVLMGSKSIELALSIAGVIVFGMYLVYDV